MKYNLPVDYDALTWKERREVREQYTLEQKGLCLCCDAPLNGPPTDKILSKEINWNLFPRGFLDHPVHLQHSHTTGRTEGALHAYCNAYWWQYLGR